MNWEAMTERQQENLIRAIFGNPKPIVDNGSDGITDDKFARYKDAQDAIENA